MANGVNQYLAPMQRTAQLRRQAGFAPMDVGQATYGGFRAPGVPVAKPTASAFAGMPSVQAVTQDDWLQRVGNFSRDFATTARQQLTESERRRASGGMAQPQQDEWIDPDTARARLREGAPVIDEVAKDPAGAWERVTGTDVDSSLELLRQQASATGADIPQDLSRQEKGLLLAQLGFGIMAGGPSLMQAIAQAGLATMGTWDQLMERKRARAAAGAEAQRDVTKAGLDVALSREQMASRERIASERTTRPQSPIGELRADLTSGAITQQDFDAEVARRGRAYGLGPTALMQNIEGLAEIKGIDKADAADLLLMGAAARNRDPEKWEKELYQYRIEEEGDTPEEAAEFVVQAVDVFKQREEQPWKQAEAAESEEPGIGKQVLTGIGEWLGKQRDALRGGGSSETATAAPSRSAATAEDLETLTKGMEPGEEFEVPGGMKGPDGRTYYRFRYTGVPGEELETVE